MTIQLSRSVYLNILDVNFIFWFFNTYLNFFPLNIRSYLSSLFIASLKFINLLFFGLYSLFSWKFLAYSAIICLFLKIFCYFICSIFLISLSFFIMVFFKVIFLTMWWCSLVFLISLVFLYSLHFFLCFFLNFFAHLFKYFRH